ncbi:PIN domain-containing protein [Roseateles toxinivorans]|uniref:Putative nucleic acid-binding protein n=1 Tax=Roseateles toxinivorans TaxID=270368 RepID=A0A4R6QPR9_9BURK|nr:PIN domain-containing protein [Roseateles toxinivorans]TDP72492.1 putative nucleic acid-binding protein [Roseateles toxinivorans]
MKAGRRSRQPITVVLDTALVLAALFQNEGQAARLRQAWQTGRVLPLLSAATAQELLAALAFRRFRLTALEQEELLGDLLPFARVVQVGQGMDRPANALLQLTLAGRADQLVSGDALLRRDAQKQGLPASTPEAFVSLFS